ncbi:MAG: glycoside hydrolase family 3 C-terminal domain-containing protein [Haliscomenobacter sp.]|nr:glycoside hydrolase family 3 C-terminal domain-containing protein [Haliscomenobacter sp.]
MAVVVIGEKTPYAEGGGDRSSLVLGPEDVNLLKTLKEKGIPTIALLVSGRPMVFGELLPYSDAMLAVWYPGTEGDGIAEVLFGDYLPSGKLTHSWPKTMAQIPINVEDSHYNPLYGYKHGLDQFPTKVSAPALVPYAASTTPSGDKIVLALSDKITLAEALHSDFTVKINGAVIPNLLREIRIASYDKSILLLALNRAIDVAENITLSYSGKNIASEGLVLDSLANFSCIMPSPLATKPMRRPGG